MKKVLAMSGLLVSLVFIASPAMANELQNRYESRLSEINWDLAQMEDRKVGSECEASLIKLKDEFKDTALVLDQLTCDVDNNGKLQIMERQW